MEITVRDPDPFHNHWGITLRFEDGEDCSEIIFNAMQMLRPLNVFHQGGHHRYHDRCGKWHYLEIWDLDGDKDHRLEVENIINQLKKMES